MINALEDYHTCTVCSTTVHDYGPGADAECIDGAWFHKGCVEETRIVGDIPKTLLKHRLDQLHCRHRDAVNFSSGVTPDTNEYFRNFRCDSCNKSWTIYGEPE